MGEQVNISCRVDAYPQAKTFTWAFNTSTSHALQHLHNRTNAPPHLTDRKTDHRNSLTAGRTTVLFSGGDGAGGILTKTVFSQGGDRRKDNRTSALTHYTRNNRSVMPYTPQTQQDFGTLLCWAANEVGRQPEPCAYLVVPAGEMLLTERERTIKNISRKTEFL